MQSHHRQRIPLGGIIVFFTAALAGAAVAGCGGGSSSSGSDASTTKDANGGGTGGAGGNVTGSGTGGKTGTGGTPAATSPLGQPCATSADCKMGLACVPPSDKTIYGVGGPAHGYCTMPCTMDATTLAACTAAGGICVDVGDGKTPLGYCMQTCATGGTAMKCNDRPDVACIPLMDANGNAATPACLPVCSQDSDCPAGRKCDDGLNVCVDTPGTGKAFGSHCAFDPNQQMDECAGFCVPAAGTSAAPTATFCSKGCVFGFTNECGWVDKGVSLATGGTHGICISLANMPAAGDPGFCLQLCDTVADCTNQSDPGLTCDLSAMANIGHGVCLWKGPAADGGVADAGGQ